MSRIILNSTWHVGGNVSKTMYTSIKSETRRLVSTNVLWKDENKPQSTVDAADIDLFSKQVKDWWNPNGPMKALHSMNLLRVPFVRDGLVYYEPEKRHNLPLNDKKILDVGCGGGILSEALARIGAKVTGIDASKELIDVALEHRNVDPRIADNKPDYCHSTIEEHAASYKNYYDAVVASEVIEHVNNKELFVTSCVESLKPGGRIFFTTPSRTRLGQIGTIFMAEYVLKLTPVGTHQYEKFMTPNELTFLLERNNCHVEMILGMFYHFLGNRWEFIRSYAFVFALQAVKLS